MIKVIIFDFDGVIVESLDVKTRAFAELFKDKGEEIVQQVMDYHLQNGGVSRYEKFRHIYSEILKQPLPKQEFERLCSEFSELVFDGVVLCPYVPGVLDFLQNRLETYLLYVASATPREELNRILDSRGIAHYFKQAFGAPIGKDEAVRIILEETRVFPEEVLFIGDALSDYEAAHMNSVRFIARIHDNEMLFSELSCIGKIRNFYQLDTLLKSLQSDLTVTQTDER